jgi:hypothetical protein
MHPSSGGDPIRYRFFWVDLFGERASDEENFFAAFGAPLNALRKRVTRLANAA